LLKEFVQTVSESGLLLVRKFGFYLGGVTVSSSSPSSVSSTIGSALSDLSRLRFTATITGSTPKNLSAGDWGQVSASSGGGATEEDGAALVLEDFLREGRAAASGDFSFRFTCDKSRHLNTEYIEYRNVTRYRPFTRCSGGNLTTPIVLCIAIQIRLVPKETAKNTVRYVLMKKKDTWSQ
jgi:hypothetical protein